MENFSRQENGYNVSEVDIALARIRAEYEQKIQQKEEEMLSLRTRYNDNMQEKNRLITSLERKINNLQDIVMDYVKREEKARNIINSTQNIKVLEAQRLQILYKKWTNLLDELKKKVVPIISHDELMALSHDFHYALKIMVDGSSSEHENSQQSYAKSVLSRMSGVKNDTPLQKTVTRKYTARISTGKDKHITRESFEEDVIVSQMPSEAEKFLNGEGVHIPKALGVGKEVLSIPSKEQNKKTGFSLEEALKPKESLSEIMAVFNLDD